MINIIGNIILSATSAAAAVVSRIVSDELKMWLGFSKSIIASEDLVNSDYTVTFENYQDRANLTISSNSISATPESGVYRVARNKSSQPSMEVGSNYLVSFNYTRTAGTLEFKTDNTEIAVSSGSSGSISEVIVAGNARYNFTFSPTSNITVTDISITEIAQFAPDKSGNLNNAKLYTGKALSFDGVNDYVGFSSDINNNGAVWTVAFWISNYTNVGSNYNWIIGNNTTKNIGLRNLISNAHKVFYREDGGTYYNFDTIAFKDSFTAAKRFVMSSNGTDISLYLDGQFIDSITPTSSTNLKVSRFMAGYNTTQFLVNATTSDFQLWNTPWTQADVTYDYNKPNHLVTDNPSTSIALSNLKGYWALSEGDGAIAYDSSGEGNNGTINGATYVDQQTTIPQLGMMDWSKGSNLYLNSEPTSDEGSAANITYATYSWNYRQFDNATVFGDNSVTRYRYGGIVSPSTETTLSVFVIMDDNSEPDITNNSGSGDFSIVLKGTVGSGVNSKTNVSGNIWRVSKTGTTTSGTSLLSNNGIIKYSTQSSKSFKVVGWQLEESSSPTAYRRTNGTAVTDATLVANPNNPSQDILGNSVRLREHSFNLDGTGYAEVADNDSLDFGTGAFTVECWVKADFTNTGSSINVIFILGGAYANTDTVSISTTSTKFLARVADNNLTANDNYTVGQWYHVCVTRDDSASGLCTLYIDGVAQSDTETTTASVTNALPKLIGKDTQGAARFYKNLIDDVRLYNKGLSADEVEQNYNAGLSAHEVGSSFSDDFSSDYGN